MLLEKERANQFVGNYMLLVDEFLCFLFASN